MHLKTNLPSCLALQTSCLFTKIALFFMSAEDYGWGYFLQADSDIQASHQKKYSRKWLRLQLSRIRGHCQRGTIQNLSCREQWLTGGVLAETALQCRQKLNHSAALNISAGSCSGCCCQLQTREGPCVHHYAWKFYFSVHCCFFGHLFCFCLQWMTDKLRDSGEIQHVEHEYISNRQLLG